MNKFAYILITPAHNEAVFIEKTIKSVINQNRLTEIEETGHERLYKETKERTK